MHSAILDMPAVWGFLGALIYALVLLIKALWGEEPVSGNRRKRALAEFGLAVIVGPVMAEGFGPSLFNLSWLQALDHRAVSLTVGLSANYLWPIVVHALGRRISRQIDDREQPK